MEDRGGLDENRYTVTVYCPECKKPWHVSVKLGDFFKWVDGAPIAECFPYLSRDDKEAFLTGYCTSCWDKMFKDEA